MPLHLPFIHCLALGTILTVDMMANIIFPICKLAGGTCVCVCVCVCVNVYTYVYAYAYFKGSRKHVHMYLPFVTIPACFVNRNL
jgi:hypothetical protein